MPAVHKMTGRTADVFGLVDRGVIRPGAYAGLVFFDLATMRDAAGFETPIRPAEGVLGSLGQRTVGLRAKPRRGRRDLREGRRMLMRNRA